MIQSKIVQTRPGIPPILLSLLRSDLTVLWRQAKSAVLSLFLPLIFVISWKGVVDTYGAGYVLATSITVGLVGIGLLTYPGLVARDRERGVFQRLRAAPIPAWTIMVSRLLVHLLLIAIMTAVVLAAGVLLYSMTLDAGSVVLIMVISLLTGSIFLAIGQAIVGLITGADAVNSTTRILSLPLIFVGGLGELGYLGDAIKTIVQWSPFGVAESLIQYVVSPAAWTGQLGVVVLLAVVYVVAFTVIGIRWFKWSIG